MGYETSFSIQLIDTTNPARVFTTKWLQEAKVAEQYDSDWALNSDNNFSLHRGEGLKWYDHHGDMIEVSRQHPTIVFILDGVGEDTGDIWRKFYLAGSSFEWKTLIEPPEWSEEIRSNLVVASVMEA